jgi:hypothetical protein
VEEKGGKPDRKPYPLSCGVRKSRQKAQVKIMHRKLKEILHSASGRTS